MFGRHSDNHKQPQAGAATPQPSAGPVTSVTEQLKAERMSLVLFSGTVDKLLAASILATRAAAMGMEVELFLTTWGIDAFRKGAYKTNTRVSADFADYGSMMMELMQTKKAPTWMTNLETLYVNTPNRGSLADLPGSRFALR